MSAVNDLRAALVADLGEVGVPVHVSFPRRLEAPALLVSTPLSGAYITPGQTLGSYRLNVDLWIVIRPHDGDESKDLDQITEHVESILENTADWGFAGADVPFLTTIQGAPYVASIVHLSKQFDLD